MILSQCWWTSIWLIKWAIFGYLFFKFNYYFIYCSLLEEALLSYKKSRDFYVSMLIIIWNIQKSGSKNARCVCVCVCLCLCACLNVFVRIQACLRVMMRICPCLCILVRVRACSCVRARVSVFECVSACRCVFVSVFACAYACMRLFCFCGWLFVFVCICVCLCMFVCECAHMCFCVFVCVFARICACVYVRAWPCARGPVVEEKWYSIFSNKTQPNNKLVFFKSKIFFFWSFNFQWSESLFTNITTIIQAQYVNRPPHL